MLEMAKPEAAEGASHDAMNDCNPSEETDVALESTANGVAASPAPKVKRNKELAMLGQPDGEAPTAAGRPSRRAAAAAQAAIAQTGAYERQRGTAMSPPKSAQQALAYRLLRAVGGGAVQPVATRPAAAAGEEDAKAAAAGGSDEPAAPALNRKRAAGGGPGPAEEEAPSKRAKSSAAKSATPAKKAAPGSEAGGSKERPSDWVPPGWTVVLKEKQSGTSKGSRYKNYRHDASGKNFKSYVQAKAFWDAAPQPGAVEKSGAGGPKQAAAGAGKKAAAESVATKKRPLDSPSKQTPRPAAAAAAAAEEAGGSKASAKGSKATPAKRTPKAPRSAAAADAKVAASPAPTMANKAAAKKRARSTVATPPAAVAVKVAADAAQRPADCAAAGEMPAQSTAADVAATAAVPSVQQAPGSAARPGAYSRLLANAVPSSPPPVAAEPPGEAADRPTSAVRAPPTREVVEAAGADIPSLMALAASCSSVSDVVAAIDALLPAQKGNNLAARLLRVAFGALQLGPFPTRQRAVPMMARALWTLSGKDGEEAARVAASFMFVSDLPHVLRPFGLAEPPPGATPVAAAARARSISEPSANGRPMAPEAAALHQPSVSLALFDPRVVRVAEKVREALRLLPGQSASLKMIMRTGLLAGAAVRLQKKRSGEVLLTGRVAGGESAAIVCDCAQCGGAAEVSPSEFEAHAGSRDRRPADAIFMTEVGHSLKELLQLVNSAEMAADLHMDHCYACKQGGELVCCDACTAAYHLPCAALAAVPEGDWLCSLCLAEGRHKKQRGPPPPAQPQPPQLGSIFRLGLKGPPTAKPATKFGGSKPGRKPGSKPSGYAPGGRVHMVAPSAQRRLGRPVRNFNRNKRLFEGAEGGLKHGDAVHYLARGERVLSGSVVIDPAGMSGILCAHCSAIVSCSQFEAHAGHAQRRQPYEHIYTEEGLNLKAVAALLPALPEEEEDGVGLDDIADGCRDIISDLDTLAGGCVLCRNTDFQRGEFGARTIMLCDQCEREFHVGCLAEAGLAELQSLPEGDWFCSARCGRIHALLRRHVAAGQMPIPGAPDSTWQVLNGRDGQVATTYAIKAAAEILQESFDPIMDLSTNTDLLPLMLYARQYGEWDYRGVHTLLMRHKGKPIVAATVRCFGPQFAELPLIATRAAARRQGHARVLVDLFQGLLREAGVHTLVLPAAHETVATWKLGFGFVDMPPDMVRLAKQQLRILVFPGTEVLWKHMPGVEAPGGHHVLAALPSKAEAEVVAAVLADLVTAVAVAEGEEEGAAVVADLVTAVVVAEGEEEGAEAEAAAAEEGGAAVHAAPPEVALAPAALRAVSAPPPPAFPATFGMVPALPVQPDVTDLDPYEAMIQQAMAAGAAAADATPPSPVGVQAEADAGVGIDVQQGAASPAEVPPAETAGADPGANADVAELGARSTGELPAAAAQPVEPEVHHEAELEQVGAGTSMMDMQPTVAALPGAAVDPEESELWPPAPLPAPVDEAAAAGPSRLQ